ncbi:hypothetical protein K488DRAFT_80919 [Vararia minispora EC-137]|uniref:Uncharacterized protein n=1 Tax=Vararia minispora EC-137 TaxID=1314806 RepID=A0ACB8Q9N2_9AGAM|nr:hypothetical protein K488DRAFT_80919 [Vararia minispora EC-137]
MASLKDKYYWGQLRAALTSGAWGSSAPAKAYRGTPISWSELFRKFNKHNPGFREVEEVANCTQHLSLLIVGDSSDDALDGGQVPTDQYALDLGEECVIENGRSEEATETFERLKSFEPGSVPSDSRYLALAYFAYALGQPGECLSHLTKVHDLTEAQSRLKPLESLRSTLSSVNAQTSESVAVSSSFMSSFASLDTSSSIAEITNGNTWAATEVIRSICLQGMCTEKTKPDAPQEALSIYLTAVLSIPTLETEIARSAPDGPAPPTTIGSVRLQYTAFTRYRETWRWAERILWRAVVLAAQTYPLGSQDEGVLWTLLARYQACSAHWPPSFRPVHRVTVGGLHLRAFVLHARASTTPADGKAPWVADARRVVREMRDVLSATTAFPRADTRNVRVEDLVDLAVAIWDASGASGVQTGWVMDILWWATRLTFNSPRVFRHMTRVADASGDAQLAARTLRLYAAVVSKARQAGEVEDMDTDENWVGTLVSGARMLCRSALADGERGIDEAREAGIMLEKARERLHESDKEMVARVELAVGVWETTMAIKESDHLSRTPRLISALTHLELSLEAHPTPSAHYHLALAHSRPLPARNLERAIFSARAAVEGAPTEIRYWHLLGLLLVAAEDVVAAREVLEVGTAITDETWASGDTPTASANGNADSTINGLTASLANAAAASALAQTELVPVLQPHDTDVPRAATLLPPVPDHPVSMPLERFEQALQLRMTQLAVTELAEGAEGAGDKWLEVFAWVAEQKGVNRTPSQRTSIDTARSRRSGEFKEQQARTSDGIPAHYNTVEPPYSVMPPITVSPPSPSSATMAEKDGKDGRHSSDDANGNVKEKEKDGKGTAGKKVQKMLQDRVKKGQQGMSTISKKIGHGVSRRRHSPYQASSIHSRRFSPFASTVELSEPDAPQPPPPQPPAAPPPRDTSEQSRRNRRLMSDLWLMSAATFRRAGKVEQSKSAIQEAEMLDEENPGVWVQLGLYHAALNQRVRALQSFNKALFISPSHVPATIYLAQAYLSPNPGVTLEPDAIDLAAGMLADLTRGAGWDIPEAWLFLARAHGARGARNRERECLCYALGLAQGKPLRDFGAAVGWAL